MYVQIVRALKKEISDRISTLIFGSSTKFAKEHACHLSKDKHLSEHGHGCHSCNSLGLLREREVNALWIVGFKNEGFMV